MSKGFAIILLGAILLLTATVMQEGGPLDSIANGEIATEEQAEEPAGNVMAASARTPTPVSTEAGLPPQAWFEEDDEADAAPAVPVRHTENAPRQRPSTEIGAIPYAQHNIEE